MAHTFFGFPHRPIETAAAPVKAASKSIAKPAPKPPKAKAKPTARKAVKTPAPAVPAADTAQSGTSPDNEPGAPAA